MSVEVECLGSGRHIRRAEILFSACNQISMALPFTPPEILMK